MEWSVAVLISTVPALILLGTRAEASTNSNIDSISMPGEPRYTSSWAVEIHGGAAVADLLAGKHGFLNLGKVKEPVTVFLL